MMDRDQNTSRPARHIDPKDYKFTEDEMQSFRDLGAVLRQIHNRLISEGYTITDDEIIPPPHVGKNRKPNIQKDSKRRLP